MPDPFMPDVQVEVAFNAGYTTPAASRTWTDVSAYVELDKLIDIVVGRRDERATADANQLTLTLDNSDGRFTAGRAASPYFPNVKLGRPIRVRVTPPGGTTSTRFVGFVNEWPVEWDGSDAYARATITASSRISRLGLTNILGALVEADILRDGPVAYYPLSEPEGSVKAFDASGRGASPLSPTPGIAPTFGTATGPGGDGLTAASFTYTGGARMLTPGPLLTSASAWTIEAFFLTTESAVMSLIALKDSGSEPGATLAPEILIDGATGNLIGRVAPANAISASVSAADGATHHAALTCSGTTLRLYFDGAQVGTMTITGTPVFPRFGLGSFGGTVAHAAVYDTALSAARIAEHYAAGMTGAAGERTDERVLHLLDVVGVAAAEVTAEVGQETVSAQETSGRSVTDCLREIEATEGGVLFDGPDGQVRFHNRAHRYTAATAATLNMASQHVGSDFQPKLDRSALVNDATVTQSTTRETARVIDTASRDEYGTAQASTSSLAEDPDALLQQAEWLVLSYSTPRLRVPSLSVDVLAHQGLTPSAQTLLGLGIGDLIAVSNAPTQADATSASYFVEGYSESIGPESYSITFNLSPSYPTLSTFVLGDATRGKLDDAYVLAL